MKDNKYRRYRMTYPHESYKIYKSKSIYNIIKKCYEECKLSNVSFDKIIITDVDKNIEYEFVINKS